MPFDGCRHLQAGGGVDHVARGHRLALARSRADGDERLAAVDPDAHPQALALVARPGADGEGRPDRSLGVVLVGDRRAEQRHHGIADELLDRAPEAFELRTKAVVIRRQQRTHVLRVEPFGPGREAGKIGEQDGDDFPFLAPGPERSVGDRGATERAERERAGQLPATARAPHPEKSRLGDAAGFGADPDRHRPGGGRHLECPRVGHPPGRQSS